MTISVGVRAGTRPAGAAASAQQDRRFFMTMALVILAVVFVGFAPTYYLRGMYHAEPLHSVFRVHGAIFSIWVLLFIAQTTLVSLKRTDIHRRLGLVALALVPVMLVVGYMAALTAARRGFSVPGLPPPLVFLAVPLFDLPVFACLVGPALYFRKQPAIHKRLMLLAMISILPAAIARLPHLLPFGPLAFFGLADLLIVACMVYDWFTRGRVSPAFLWGGLFVTASQPLRLMVGGTSAWIAFAQWLTAG
jgi:hypothetical protein